MGVESHRYIYIVARYNDDSAFVTMAMVERGGRRRVSTVRAYSGAERERIPGCLNELRIYSVQRFAHVVLMLMFMSV